MGDLFNYVRTPLLYYPEVENTFDTLTLPCFIM